MKFAQNKYMITLGRNLIFVNFLFREAFAHGIKMLREDAHSAQRNMAAGAAAFRRECVSPAMITGR